MEREKKCIYTIFLQTRYPASNVYGVKKREMMRITNTFDSEKQQKSIWKFILKNQRP